MANDNDDLAHRADELLGEYLTRQSKRGRPRKGASLSVYHRRAVDLLEECAHDGAPPPENLVHLIATFLEVPEAEPLSESQKRALERELRFQRFTPGGKWFTNLPVQHVADYAKVTRPTVYSYRNDPNYRRAFLRQLDERIAKKLIPRLEERDVVRAQTAVMPALSENERHRRQAVEVAAQWTGPVRSPIDGKLYSTPNDYAQHLREEDALLASSDRVKKK